MRLTQSLSLIHTGGKKSIKSGCHCVYVTHTHNPSFLAVVFVLFVCLKEGQSHLVASAISATTSSIAAVVAALLATATASSVVVVVSKAAR